MYKLFISHSSKDIDLVERLLILFQLGMGISREDIFCTSLTGTLETGKPYIEKTRKVVTECNAVVFCMTDSYLQSKFCLAELGAAWACNQQIFPLLAPGMTEAAFANTPLDGVQCLHMDRKADLHQLGDDFQNLGLASLSLTRYGKEVERFLNEEVITAGGMSHSTIANTEYQKVMDDMGVFERQARSDLSTRFLVGSMYLEGILIPENKEKAYDFLKWAADDGYAPAIELMASQCRQGVCNLYGMSDMFHKIRQAESETKTVAGLGVYYQLGIGCEIDMEKALHCYEQEADLGIVDAYQSLGDMYQMHGRYEEAIRCYAYCVKEGSVSAAYQLGMLYQNDCGENASLNKAIYYLNFAANAGMAEAKYQLGEIYFIEYGLLKRNFSLAAKAYLAAAKEGHTAACERIGYCCHHGLGVSENRKEAMEWYRKAADHGYGKAQLELADLLAAEKKYEEAFQWYESAAKQGFAEAYRKQGDLYLYGLGIEKDVAAAIKCYESAARQNEAVAMLRLKELCPN